MAQSVIGALRVNLGLDSAQFESGAKRSKSTLEGMRKSFLAVSAVAAALGAALGGLAAKGAADIDRAAKAARRLETSIGGFRALEMAAGEAGVALSSLTDAVQTMDREVAKGGKVATAALTTLGIAARDLEGLEADQKLALVADRIRDLGLSTGQTTALLQALGIRQRDIVLLLQGGGDALRQARTDVESYGLALSSVDASKIEQANDRIGRLGLIGQYAAQQISRELTPAFGALALAMTESLREGGVLRGVINGIAGNLQRLIAYVGVTVAAFGIRYVAALAAARLATLTLAGTVGVLGAALLRLPFVLLVVGAGELIIWFSRLVSATGGWAEALEILGRVASGVWEGIKTSASSIPPALGAVWQNVKAGFLGMLVTISDEWSRFLSNFSSSVPDLPGFRWAREALAESSGKAVENMSKFDAAMVRAQNTAKTLRSEADSLATSGFDKARAALQELRDVMAKSNEESPATVAAIDNITSSLDDMGNGGGKAAKAVKEELDPALQELEQRQRSFQDTVGGAFSALVTGAKSAKQAVADLLGQLAQMLANNAFKMLLDGPLGGSGIFKGIQSFFTSIPKFATGTNYAPGGMALVGERGPELVNLPRGSQVLPNQETMDAFGGGNVSVTPKIVNVLDPSIVGQFLGTRDGERMILNVMQRNGIQSA